MSMSLRDQLLAAGLVSQKQVREAERQQQHQERAQQQSKQKRRPPHQENSGKKPGQGAAANTGPGHAATGNPASGDAARVSAASAPAGSALSGQAHGVAISSAAARNAAAQSAKVARDLALNKKQQEKARQKARAAEIKQLIAQNRVPRGDSEERYNFVDGGRVRFIAANAEIRRRLMAGELFIVRHDNVYDVVPAATAHRIRERDARSVIDAATSGAPETAPIDEAYKDFAVPDDLMW